MTTTVRETLADFEAFERELPIPEPRRLRAAYGFDDVAIVPGVETLHPDDIDLSWELGGRRFPIPFVASAMDGVVDVAFAIALGKLGRDRCRLARHGDRAHAAALPGAHPR